METWRLIIDDAAEGTVNMGVDRALLLSHEAGDGPPTLRLYRWARPTVSLGRFQDSSDVDQAYCSAHGIGICRRPTGGRGVLHDDELTYSVVAGVRDGLPRGVAASYRMLCGALVDAYRGLGIDAELTSRSRGARGVGACYLHATAADLSLGAAKLSGSAQVWSRESCLQHGSLVLSRDVAREAAAFRLDAAAAEVLAASTRTITDACGSRPEDAALIAAVRSGFESAFGVSLGPGALSLEERAAAAESAAEARLGLR